MGDFILGIGTPEKWVGVDTELTPSQTYGDWNFPRFLWHINYQFVKNFFKSLEDKHLGLKSKGEIYNQKSNGNIYDRAYIIDPKNNLNLLVSERGNAGKYEYNLLDKYNLTVHSGKSHMLQRWDESEYQSLYPLGGSVCKGIYNMFP